MVGEGHYGGENRRPKIGWGALNIGGILLGGCLSVFPPWGVLQFGVHLAPSPVSGVPGFGAYEVLKVAALEISGLCKSAVSEVSPSSSPHTPAPSVHRIHRQLAPPEQ